MNLFDSAMSSSYFTDFRPNPEIETHKLLWASVAKKDEQGWIFLLIMNGWQIFFNALINHSGDTLSSSNYCITHDLIVKSKGLLERGEGVSCFQEQLLRFSCMTNEWTPRNVTQTGRVRRKELNFIWIMSNLNMLKVILRRYWCYLRTYAQKTQKNVLCPTVNTNII